MKLISIPTNKYSDYRYEVIFKAYKWDPQVDDHNTISKYVCLMNEETAKQLETWAEELSRETILMEEALIHNLSLAKDLGFPKKILKELKKLKDYDKNKHIRLMRFDFHPIEEGWAISEVNSDVPGGFAEASILPEIASKLFEKCKPYKNSADILLKEFKSRLKNNARIAFIYATSYSDDRQVMEFLSDHFNENGFDTVFAGPDHIKWNDKKAYNIVYGQEGNIDGIIRFFPLEWLVNLSPKANWEGYYTTETCSCNHPISIFAQSKRLPLIWDKLEIDIPTWKRLLPATIDPRLIKSKDDDWILKPTLGRVGEDISIKGTIPEKELLDIFKVAQRHPNDWVAQRLFKSKPLITENNEAYHLCVGVFTINAKSAGFYGRISPYPRIDARAEDIPILVSKAVKNEKL